MVFASRFKCATRAPKQGEIALTLTVLSLITMLVGTVIGLNRTQDVRTNAAVPIEKVQCGGFGCSNNSDCLQTPIKTLCHVSTGQCRPMSSKDSCPSVTARIESSKKDVGASCITKTDCKTGLDCSPGRICTVPAGGGGGGAGTDGGAAGTPIVLPTLQDRTRYRTYPGQCEMLFSNIDDPRIMRITLSTTSGNVVFDTDKEQNGCMPFNSPSKGDSISINYDPRIQQNVIIRSTSSGGLGGTNKTCTFGRRNLNNGVEADPLVVTMYYQVQQGLIGQRVWNSYSQSANTTGGCVARRNSPTPTKTPTPSIPIGTPFTTFTPKKLACGDSCTFDAQCPLTEYGQTVCRTPKFVDSRNPRQKYCLLEYDDALDCKPKATGSPTPTKTPTPTPTKTPTPTATVTPPPPLECRAEVNFLIDASETFQKNLSTYADGINKVVNDYKTANPRKEMKFTTSFFARDVRNPIVAPPDKEFVFPFVSGLHWTNIKAALEQSVGTTVFISDGLPSVVQYPSNEREEVAKSFCVYPNGDLMKGKSSRGAHGCAPLEDTKDGYTRAGGRNCNSVCNTESYADARRDTIAAARNKRNTYGLYVAAGLHSDRTFMEAVSKKVVSIDEVGPLLVEVFNDACEDGRLSGSGAPRPFMGTFSVQNKSTNKTVQKVTVKTCSETGTECKDFVTPLQVAPQQTKSFSQVIPDSVPVTSRELVTCSVGYTDGSSLPCPRKATQNESVQFNLSVNNRVVSGTSQTFLQASDVNGDGRVNALDLALCARKSPKCDIVIDNVVNAQDHAVVLERVGQTTQ